ncbi:MAG: glycosyltransferase family 4 protein [Elusimicrobiaceae bacterium]|nr:glycosyltransferase family 4 protein [Elusimicrobiaceae bacterium]
MKIIQYADESWDSGLTEYALTLARALAARGHACYFMAAPDGYARKRAEQFGLPVLAAEKSAGGFFRLLQQLRAIKPEIINAHTGSAHSHSVMLAAAGLPGTAVIRTRADARELRRKPFSGLLWNRTAGFIAANSRIMNRFAAVFGGGIKAELIPQGIFTPQTPPVPAQGLKIGLVGRLDPVKGHTVALEAMAQVLARHPGARLLVAGEDRNVTADGLKKMAAGLGIENSIEFYGRLGDVFRFMDGCALGIVPSAGSEAVSRVALEWMSRARPVIASDVGGLADLVRDGLTGALVPPGEPDALAGKISGYLSAPQKLAEAGRSGRAYYEERFTPETFAAASENFYRKVIA